MTNLEDSGRIVGNDIDTTELLHKHNDPGGQGSATVARNSEKLQEHGEEVLSLVDLPLQLHGYISIIQVSRCLNIGRS